MRVKRFPKELGCNFLAVWSHENLVPLAIGTGAALSVRSVDDNVAGYFSTPGRWTGYDTVGRHLGRSAMIAPAVGVTFLVGRVTSDEKFQRFSYSLAQAFTLNLAMTHGMKEIARRRRPDEADQRSFFSGHTSNSFVVANVVANHYGW